MKLIDFTLSNNVSVTRRCVVRRKRSDSWRLVLKGSDHSGNLQHLKPAK